MKLLHVKRVKCALDRISRVRDAIVKLQIGRRTLCVFFSSIHDVILVVYLVFCG